MRRLLSAIVVLVLLISCSAALAEDWVCPECGQENTLNFCTNCGTARPGPKTWICSKCGYENDLNFCANCGSPKDNSETGEAGASVAQPIANAETLSDLQFKLQDNGDVLVTWEDSADSGPYIVGYTTNDWKGYMKYEKESYNSCSAIIEYMIPGLEYHFIVSNESSYMEGDYLLPRFETNVFKTKWIDFYDINDNWYPLEDFTINNDYYSNKIRVFIGYPYLTKTRYYKCKLALKTPEGYTPYVDLTPEFEFRRKQEGTMTDFSLFLEFSFKNYLDYFKIMHDRIPSGKYILEFFCEGGFYDYAEMNITVEGDNGSKLSSSVSKYPQLMIPAFDALASGIQKQISGSSGSQKSSSASQIRPTEKPETKSTKVERLSDEEYNKYAALFIGIVKGTLKKPDSMEVHWISVKEYKNDTYIVFSFSAMNGFGGYTRDTYSFKFTPGHISLSGTASDYNAYENHSSEFSDITSLDVSTVMRNVK